MQVIESLLPFLVSAAASAILAVSIDSFPTLVLQALAATVVFNIALIALLDLMLRQRLQRQRLPLADSETPTTVAVDDVTTTSAEIVS